MNEGKDIFAQAEEEYRELNNELVVPTYRRFCEEFNLPFHFWDELPKDSFNPEISGRSETPPMISGSMPIKILINMMV